MKNNIQKKPIFLIFASFILFSIYGCDRITAFFEGFKKAKAAPQTIETANHNHLSSPPKVIQPPEAPDVQTASAAVLAEPSVQMSANKTAGNVLAAVGGWQITVEEFDDRLKALKEILPDLDTVNLDNKKSILEELVRQQLLVWDAEQSGLAKEKDVSAAIEEFRRTLLVREVVGRLTENIKATEEEAKDFYEKNKEAMVAPVEWHLREIVVDNQLTANELLVEILKGTDFAETAKQKSIAESKDNGGDLGFVKDVPFKELAPVLLSLNVGDVSGVVKGPKGFYIIKLEEKRGGEPVPFEDLKEEITDQVSFEKQQQAILDYIDQLKKKIKTEVNEDLLK